MSVDEIPPGHFRYQGVILDNSCSSEHLQRCLAAKYMPSDIFVVSYPRSGTLLTQEIIWHIMNKSNIELNQKHNDFLKCFPFLELSPSDQFPDPLQILDSEINREYRLIKTHLNEHIIFPALDSIKPKIVLLMRNPKDVMVSMYEFYRTFSLDYEDWPYNWDNFFHNFVKNKVWYGNYFEWCQGWLKRTDLPNVCVIHYEDMLRKKRESIKLLAEFLAQGDINDCQVDIIVKNTDFKKMYDNDATNPDFGQGRLMRKGKIGAWKSHFSDAQSFHIDYLIDKYFNHIDINTE